MTEVQHGLSDPNRHGLGKGRSIDSNGLDEKREAGKTHTPRGGSTSSGRAASTKFDDGSSQANLGCVANLGR